MKTTEQDCATHSQQHHKPQEIQPIICKAEIQTKGCIEAEPVQLLELLRKLRISAKRDGELGRDSVRTDEIEQKVRQLLADHGVKVVE